MRHAISLGSIAALALAASVALASTPPAPVPRTTAVPGGAPHAIETHAVADTPWTVERPHPRATYGSYARARDRLEVLVRRVLGAHADSAMWQRAETSFVYRDSLALERSITGNPFWTVKAREAPSRVPALLMSLETHIENGPDASAIGHALEKEGWAEDFVYSADGPDGTVFAFVCREALCLVQGSWDGGDDSDTTYVPAPGETIDLVCFPRTPEQAPGRPGSAPKRR